MDELIKALELGEPVMVEIDYSMTRVCAELFKIEGGVAFIDIGWNDQYGCSHNPIHIVKGPVEKVNNRWIILEMMPNGKQREFVFSRIRKDKPQYAEWEAWEREKHKQGKVYDREVVRQAVEELICY